MAQALASLDWSRLQAFLAVAETGSLSAAARKLNASQPTIGRQVRALEAEMGAALFRRQARGMALTDTGAALLEPVQAMRKAAETAALTAAGREQRLEGVVRITASAAMSMLHLPAIIADLRRAEPRIQIELVPSDATSNLLFREADIAVRMYRPVQQELVARHIGDAGISIFASAGYLARRGRPRAPKDLLIHDLVGYDASPLILDGFAAAGMPVTRDQFAVRCDDNAVYIALVRAGCGIGFVQASAGRRDPDLEEIVLDLDLPALPVWLTAHGAMRHTPRIRRVWDALADGLARAIAK